MILGVIITYVLVFITIGIIYAVKGDVIFKGEKGDTGPTGLKGDTGVQGPRGFIGETGEKGNIGPEGPAWYACGANLDPTFNITPYNNFTSCGSLDEKDEPGTLPTVDNCKKHVPGVSTPAPNINAEYPWKGINYYDDKPAGCFRDENTDNKGTYYNTNLGSNVMPSGNIKQICRQCVPVSTTSPSVTDGSPASSDSDTSTPMPGSV